MGIVLAVGICLVLVALGELARRGVARVLGVPVTPIARVFADFRSGSRVRRVLALGAGSLMTLGAVIALAFVVFRFDGMPTGEYRYSVSRVAPDMPAVGKLQSGDRLLAVNGRALGYASLWELVDGARGEPVRISYERAGAQHEVTLQPVRREGRWVIGIFPNLEAVKYYDTQRAFRAARRFPGDRIALHLALDDTPDPGGPTRLLEEFPVYQGSLVSRAARHALDFSIYILALMVLLDFARAAFVIARR